MGVLQRLFRVLPEEASKVGHFLVLAMLLQAGLAIGLTAADALFLAHVGASELPYVYLLMPLVTVLYAPLYAVLLQRLGINRLFAGTLLLLAGGGLLIGVFLPPLSAQTPLFVYALKFYVGLWIIALYTLYWNFADEYFSILDGKRLYGLIAAAASTGSMLGAGAVAMLINYVSPQQMFLVWGGLALLCTPVLARLVNGHKRLISDAADELQPAGVVQALSGLWTTLRRSGFAMALLMMCFAGVHLAAFAEYLALGVISSKLDESQLAALLGQLLAIASALTLVINLFLFHRLVGAFGVAGTALVLPITFLIAFSGLYLNGSFAAALVAFYVYQAVLPSVEYNNINLLFSALPARIKGSLRTIIEALAEPLATALAGLILLAYAESLGLENLALLALALTLLALAVALYVRNSYVPQLARNLRLDWLDFAPDPTRWSQELSPLDRRLLYEKARSDSFDERRIAIEILWKIDDPEARPGLLRALAAADSDQATKLAPTVAQWLNRRDSDALADALLWLESDQAPLDPQRLHAFTAEGVLPVGRVQSWRWQDQPESVAATAVARWHSARLADTELAVGKLRSLLGSTDTAARLVAIRAIGDLRHTVHAAELIELLEDANPAIRLETLRALLKLASPGAAALFMPILRRFGESDAAARGLILAIAERIGDPRLFAELLQTSGHFSSTEARQLESALALLGLKAVPTAMQVLRAHAAPLHSRSIAARALSRIALAQLLLSSEEIIGHEMVRAERALDSHRVIAAELAQTASDGLLVLARLYRDNAADHLEFVLELLSLSGQLPDFDLIRASLSFANARDRANAVETIVQSCPRDLARRIQRLMQGLGHWRDARPVAAEAIGHALEEASQSAEPLEAAAALLAMDDMQIDGVVDRVQARLYSERLDEARARRLCVELLPRLVADRNADVSGATTHAVRRVASLLRAPLFAEARVRALEFIATKAEESWIAAGERIYALGEPSDLGYLLIDGHVRLTSGHGQHDLSPGQAFGERVLMGDRVRRDDAQALTDVRVMLVPGAVLARAIEVYPALGISLYTFKTVANTQ